MTRILIVGGYGTFGARLAALLADDARLTLHIAGRSLPKAQTLCACIAARATLIPTIFDRNKDAAAQLAPIEPDLVIDASGPFQAYGDEPYRLVEACIAGNIAYLDLADGADFVAGIARFDAAARARNVFVLSGASTLPVLSTAATRELTTGWRAVHSIAVGIAPSGHVDLGKSVIDAIASYAGKMLALPQGGRAALIDARRVTIGPPATVPLASRRFSLVDVPDLRLAPALWPDLQSLWFGAGTVPLFAHVGLSALAWLVRLKLLRSLRPFAALLHAASNAMHFGEHRGGMFVSVTGESAAAEPIARSWHLVAEGDDGPFIPVMAAAALVQKIANGNLPATGARAAQDDITLADYAPFFATRQIRTGTHTILPPAAALYRRILSDA